MYNWTKHFYKNNIFWDKHVNTKEKGLCVSISFFNIYGSAFTTVTFNARIFFYNLFMYLISMRYTFVILVEDDDLSLSTQKHAWCVNQFWHPSKSIFMLNVESSNTEIRFLSNVCLREMEMQLYIRHST